MNNIVITIGREFGSGGKEIGQLLAKKLNIKCYDKEILALASESSGISEEMLENHDEKPTNSFLYSLAMENSMGYTNPGLIDLPLNQKVFMAQYNTIKNLSETESFVLIGRCGDYVLKDMYNCVSVFIKSSMDYKIKRITECYDLTEDRARELIIKSDKKRANYYNFYTTKKWADARSYDLCLDSSKLSPEHIVTFLKQYIDFRFPQYWDR